MAPRSDLKCSDFKCASRAFEFVHHSIRVRIGRSEHPGYEKI
jgi:hypothetical protein